MSEYIFEEIRPEHLEKVLDIYNYYVLNSTATFHEHPLSVAEMKELVFFENAKYKTVVIYQNHDLCGYVSLKQFSKREAYDRTAEVAIYLQPESIGQGVGAACLKHIEEIAQANKLHVLLAIISGNNEKSISLFAKHGYSKCAHYKEVGMKFGQLLDVVTYQKLI